MVVLSSTVIMATHVGRGSASNNNDKRNPEIIDANGVIRKSDQILIQIFFFNFSNRCYFYKVSLIPVFVTIIIFNTFTQLL